MWCIMCILAIATVLCRRDCFECLYSYIGVGLSALLVSTRRAMRRPIDRGTGNRLAPRFFVCINRNNNNPKLWKPAFVLYNIVALSNLHCEKELSGRNIFEERLSILEEKRSLALFVKQVMSVVLKGYEYKAKVISAEDPEVIELKSCINALKAFKLYVLIEAKNIYEQVAKVEKFTNKSVFVVNKNLICLVEGENVNATHLEGTNNQISKLYNIGQSNKKVSFRKSKTVLPLWLDKYLFEELDAKYAPEHTRYEYNLDLNESELKVYLGTYFPRSYAEIFCIFDNIFQQKTICQVYKSKKKINIFDFCCGTGGELIGLLLTLDKYFEDSKNLNIIVCDGNEKALDYLYKIIDKAGRLSKHQYNLLSIHKEITNWDDVEKLEIPSLAFDIELCDKVCCEFISHGVNKQSYEYLASFLSKRLSKDGLLVMLDVTTQCKESKMFYPQMMNSQINNFVRSSSEIETLLPLSCAAYKDCRIPCFTQQTFQVSHLRKKDDKSRVSYRVLCRKEFKNYLMTNSLASNTTYIINHQKYQQNVEGAYCCNSKGNENFIDSFNINV